MGLRAAAGYIARVMNDSVRVELIEMARAEDAMRAEVSDVGDTEVLAPGEAHHELVALRREHNKRLREIIGAHGWPGAKLAGTDGSEAAWRLAMFATDDRELQGECLMLMEDMAEEGDVDAWQPACLLDRLLAVDGKEQVYGSQFTLKDGAVEPFPVSDTAVVDARRKAIGLDPIEEALEGIRARRA